MKYCFLVTHDNMQVTDVITQILPLSSLQSVKLSILAYRLFSLAYYLVSACIIPGVGDPEMKCILL